MIRTLLTVLMFAAFCAFQAGCGGSGGGSGASATNQGDNPAPQPTPETFALSKMSLPATVQKGQQASISADIEGKDSEIILFQFETNNGKNHMVPHSGIIATHDKTGHLSLAYTAPAQTGKHFYYLKVLNSDGQEFLKTFDITVVD